MVKPRKFFSANKFIDGIIIVILGVVFVFAAIEYFRPSAFEQTQGQPAPPFKLTTESGEVVGPSTHRGRVVVLDFWATWCKPCLKQMPVLATLKKDPDLADDLAILSINVDDPDEHRTQKVKYVLERGGWDFDVLYDNGQVQALYGVDTLPSIVVIGPDGTVRYTGAGVHSEKRLRELIERARESSKNAS